MRAMLIYNPTAGQIWNQFKPDTAKDYLAKHHWQVDICPTQRLGGGTELARKAVQEQYDVVIAAGGDGTINEVIQTLAHTPVKLGILPVGTTNVLARELQIPLNYQEALAYLPQSQTITMDLGRINKRYFLLMAGIGFDAQVVTEINPTMKNLAGITAVVTAGVKTLFNHQPFKVKLILTNTQGRHQTLRRTVMQIMISNTSIYATDFKIAEQARFDDGILELHIFKSKRFWDTFKSLAGFLFLRKKEWTDFEHYSIKQVSIKSKLPHPIQVDGDTIGHTPAYIDVIPKALQVLKPQPTLE